LLYTAAKLSGLGLLLDLPGNLVSQKDALSSSHQHRAALGRIELQKSGAPGVGCLIRRSSDTAAGSS
jgi:hypothetical protein